MAKSLNYVRTFRKMPWVKRGMCVAVNGRLGRVTGGGDGGNIRVRFDGENHSKNVHPHWQTTYYQDGAVIADYTTV